MTLRFYDVLEATLADLARWAECAQTSKADVLDSVRERVVQLMRHVITTPLIGSAYAYPGDVDLTLLLAQAASDAPA